MVMGLVVSVGSTLALSIATIFFFDPVVPARVGIPLLVINLWFGLLFVAARVVQRAETLSNRKETRGQVAALLAVVLSLGGIGSIFTAAVSTGAGTTRTIQVYGTYEGRPRPLTVDPLVTYKCDDSDAFEFTGVGAEKVAEVPIYCIRYVLYIHVPRTVATDDLTRPPDGDDIELGGSTDRFVQWTYALGTVASLGIWRPHGDIADIPLSLDGVPPVEGYYSVDLDYGTVTSPD